MERFACPTPDRQGRYRCIDDHVLCDGFIDCPEGADEDRQACMFYKTVSKATHLSFSFLSSFFRREIALWRKKKKKLSELNEGRRETGWRYLCGLKIERITPFDVLTFVFMTFSAFFPCRSAVRSNQTHSPKTVIAAETIY